MKNKSFFLALMLIAMTAFFTIPAQAQEAVPGDACSTANHIMVSGGPETSGIGYTVVCQGGVWVRITESAANGYLGVKQAVPKAPLHVGGEAIIGTTTGVSCSSTTAGAIRYNSTGGYMEFCDGSGWASIAPTACADTTPSSYTISDLVNQNTSTLVTSSITAVSGIGCAVNVNISGQGTPAFRICSDSGCSTVVQDWTTGASTVSNGEYIQTRLTTSALGGDTYSAAVTIGSVAQSWDVTTTGDCSSSPVPGTVCSDGTIYAGDTPDGNVHMYTTRCDVGKTWDGSSCTGTRLALYWNDGESNYTTTGYTNGVTGQANSAGIAATDSNSVEAGTQSHVAAEYCEDLVQDGHSDWYLPARQEMQIICNNQSAIGDIYSHTAIFYTSSTEIDNNTYYMMTFSDCDAIANDKAIGKYLRCVRHD